MPLLRGTTTGMSKYPPNPSRLRTKREGLEFQKEIFSTRLEIAFLLSCCISDM